jgi:hypothetical protein
LDSEVVAWRIPVLRSERDVGGSETLCDYIIFQQYPRYWYENHPDKVEELIVRPKKA